MSHKYTLDLEAHRQPLVAIFQAVIEQPKLTEKALNIILRTYPKSGDGFYSRDELIAAYRSFAGTDGLPDYDAGVLERLRRKPVRTSSGVTPVTVLTKPFPCPGECIFCPNDVRMPKSYLSDEPGAQRAEQNSFDPYLQTYTRLQSYHNTGHPTDKIEVIILGGTWSFYPETYQIWFIKRVFDALHDFGKGIDGRQAVEDALLSSLAASPGSQCHQCDALTGGILSSGITQVVQTVYKGEMTRSREMADEIGRGERARSPVDEYATWEELEAAHRENETAACRMRRAGDRDTA